MPDLLCCDSTLRVMPDGRWKCFFLTGGPMEPHDDNYIGVCTSEDAGQTWSAPEPVFPEMRGCSIPTEVMCEGHMVTMFLATHDGASYGHWKTWYVTSLDSGDTWSELKPLPHYPDRTFVRNAIRVRDGRLIVPWQWSRDEPLCSNPANGVFMLEPGETFATGNVRTFGMIETVEYGWAENNVVELSDGTLAMLIRADETGCIYRSDSVDGGYTWTQATPTDIPNPGTKFRLYGLKDGRIVLIHNPNSECGNRWPMSMWISDDDMRTWGYKRDLVTFPGSLAYPDGFVDEQEGCIHFAFDYNRHDMILVSAQLP